MSWLDGNDTEWLRAWDGAHPSLAEIEDLRERIACDIEALVDYESADLPPGGTWISRAKVLELVRHGAPTPRPSGHKAAKAHGEAVPERPQGHAKPTKRGGVA